MEISLGRKGKWLLTFSASLIFLISLSLSTAEAHSTLERTVPGSGITLDKPPANIEIWFEDPVVIHSESVKVFDEKGKEVQRGKPFSDAEDPRHIVLFLQENLPPGIYTVQYNLIALDGYVIRDEYNFEIAKPSVSSEKQGEFRLIKTSPSDGEITKESPAQIELWFTHAAQVTALGVFGKESSVLAKEPYADPKDPRHVIVPLEKLPSSGTYQVTWYAVPIENSESHIRLDFQGIFYFSVNEVTSLISNQTTPLFQSFSSGFNLKHVAHWLAFFGLLTLAGGRWFQVMIANNTGNYRYWIRLSWVAFGASTAGFILLIVQRRLELAQIPLAEFITLKFVWIPALQIILLTVSTLLLRTRLQLAGFIIAVLLWPFAIGHATYPRYGGYWAVGMNFIHLLAISVWVGGLLALLVMIPKENPLPWLKQTGIKYSKWAFWSMILIILSGIGMATQFLPSFSLGSLLLSDWGKALLFKVILVILIVALAYWQRRALQQMTEKGITALVRRGRIELLYALLIIFAAAVLIESKPSAASQGVFPRSMVKENLKISVDISPMGIGPNDILLRFNGKPGLKQVKAILFMPPEWRKENIAFNLGNGTYKLSGNFLHAAGTMYMEVEAWKADGSKVVFPFRIVVPGEMRLYE